MSELIGKVVSNEIADNGFSFRVVGPYNPLASSMADPIDFTNYVARSEPNTSHANYTYYYPGYSFPRYKPAPVKIVPPSIYDVKVYNDKVVKVFFTDGTTETAVCQEGDKFDLDMGITVCVMKKIFGRNEYFRMLKKAKKNAEGHRKIEKLSKEAVEIRKRQRAKKEAKKRARREKRNKELATAIANAMNKNTSGNSILIPKKA